MSYKRINWEDSPSTNTPINAENLNKMDDGIAKAHEKLEHQSKMAILSTTKGTTPTTTDAANVPPVNLKVFGKSEQKTYAGNQLIDFSKLKDDGSGLTTLEILEEGKTIKVTGTKAYSLANTYIDTSVLVGKTIYLSGEVTGGNYPCHTFYKNYADGTRTHLASSELISGYTVEENVISLEVQLICNNTTNALDTAVTAVFTNTMLSLMQDSEWEPYVGGQPSPNPEYTQSIQKHGESGSINNWLYGRNLFNYIGSLYTEKNGLTITLLDDGGIHVVGTNTVQYTVIAGTNSYITMYPGTYYVSGGKNASGNVYLQLTYKKSDGTTDYIINKAVTFTEPTDCRIVLQTGYIAEHDCVVYPMINIGSTQADFEPYIKRQSLTLLTPNGLPGIPLGQTIPDAITNSPIHMSGVYHDGEQYWIGDTKELGSGKNVQRIGVKILDGSDDEAWFISAYEADDTVKRYLTACIGSIAIQPSTNNHKANIICDSYIVRSSNETYTGAKTGISLQASSSYGTLHIYDGTADVNDFKTRLAENPITVQYILAEPIETDLSTEEIEQYNALVMNYPNNTLINDAGAYTEVEYVCDTQEHIKQNYTPNSVTQGILERLSALEQNAVNNS